MMHQDSLEPAASDLRSNAYRSLIQDHSFSSAILSFYNAK